MSLFNTNSSVINPPCCACRHTTLSVRRCRLEATACYDKDDDSMMMVDATATGLSLRRRRAGATNQMSGCCGNPQMDKRRSSDVDASMFEPFSSVQMLRRILRSDVRTFKKRIEHWNPIKSQRSNLQKCIEQWKRVFGARAEQNRTMFELPSNLQKRLEHGENQRLEPSRNKHPELGVRAERIEQC